MINPGMSALGLDAAELIAKLQGYAASFFASKAQLYDARNRIDSLISRAQSAGYVESGGKQFSLPQLQTMKEENARLIADQADLERKFLSAIEEWNTIKEMADTSAEITVGIPGIAGVHGLDAVPVAAIAWATGAAILVGSITYFMSRVKSHLDRLAGTTAGGIIGLGTIALILGGAYFLLRR